DATALSAIPVSSVPKSARNQSTAVQIESQLEGLGGSSPLQTAVPTSRLQPHQFFIPVLASAPERYAYLRQLPSIQPPEGHWNINGIREDYFVVLPDIGRRVPLPQRGLAWTSLAYLIIDDMDPDVFTAPQRKALVDWLHWGGQMLVSGPDSIEQLQGSFLEEYLPVLPAPVSEVSEDRIARLDDYWSRVPEKAKRPPQAYKLAQAEQPPIQALEFSLAEGASFVPHTADLVATRRVGRGRVTATAFRLTDKRLINWGCFDDFFNACLLQRPARVFSENVEADVLFLNFVSEERHQDARTRTGLRFFSRDASHTGGRHSPHRYRVDKIPKEFTQSRAPIGTHARERTAIALQPQVAPNASDIADWGLGSVRPGEGFSLDPIAGVAGWNDFSEAATASREALVKASGISVPNKKFISRVLLGYLICLVPLNWLVFKAMGRVEWAWFAAPLIAISGAILVIQVAQLDIGFARSRTDVNLLELQADYPRGHLTSFSGLYTSLSTQYSAHVEDRTAMLLPFSTDPSNAQLRLQNEQEVSLHYDREARLDGYPVFSNSTGMMHSEDMVDLPGVLEAQLIGADEVELTNATGLPLQSVIVMQRLGDGVRLATTPTLAADEPQTLAFGDPGEVATILESLEDHPVTAAATPEGVVSLRGLYQLATDARQLEPGQLRLVGWCDQGLGVVRIQPEAKQHTSRTLVVANLRYDQPSAPQRDLNHPEDCDWGDFQEEVIQ
ncbi:MAG: hypothetical protein AAGF97_17540, partial [Planctomycetota bacterium]